MEPEDDSKRLASLVTPPRRTKSASASNGRQEQTAASGSLRRIAGEAELLAAEAQLKRAAAENVPDPSLGATMLEEAETLEAEAARLRDPVACGLPELHRGQGGEISPLPDSKMPNNLYEVAQAVHGPFATLAAEATVDRLTLARNANVLNLAVEASASMGQRIRFSRCSAIRSSLGIGWSCF